MSVLSISVLLLSLGLWRSGVTEYVDYEDEDEAEDEDDYSDDTDESESEFYVTITSEHEVSEEDPLTRVRRFEEQASKTLSPDEVHEVKGIIKQLLSGQENPESQLHSAAKTNAVQKSSAHISVTPQNLNSADHIVEDLKHTILRDEEHNLAMNPLRTRVLTTPAASRTFWSDSNDGNYGKTVDIAYVLRDDENRTDEDVTPTRTTDVVTTASDMETSTTTVLTTTEKPQFDVKFFLDLIANLTYDYETNLTRQVNETIQRLTVPTCGTTQTTTTTTPSTTSIFDYDNVTGVGTIIAKCFVCGLDLEQIPFNSHCADAFAGNFLPLVPIDPTARGQIAKYRKYCRYMDIPNYIENETDPRAVWGRWTGGCSVRWIDLSGVYTQRACRNRDRPSLGKHFGSKRMAKLELALTGIDNGCIISPMATLVPLSRGVSLYARFHACVCTGNWCNSAIHSQPWTLYTAILSFAFLVQAVT